MSRDEFDDLIVALRDGSLSDEGAKRLGDWAEQGDTNRSILNLFKGNSPTGDEIARMTEYDEERVWKAIVTADKRRSRRRALRRWVPAGAAACIIAAITFAVFTGRNDEGFDDIQRHGSRGAVLRLADGNRLEVGALESPLVAVDESAEINIDTGFAEFRATGPGEASAANLNTLSVPYGSDYKLLLSDGTAVWVNSGSELVFPSSFTGETREVELRGEGYFEVAHDPAKPFVVSAGGQKVTVLGTSFNISAYKEDRYVETTLVSGSVSLTVDDKTTLLKPGQQARYEQNNGSVAVFDVPSAEAYTSWIGGVFSFVDEPIESICRILSRSYGVDVKVASPSLNTVIYSGVIKRYDSFSELAELMEATGEMTFVRRNGAIIVTPAK